MKLSSGHGEKACRAGLLLALVLVALAATSAPAAAAGARAKVIAGRLRYVEVGNHVNQVTMTVDINGDLIIQDLVVIEPSIGCTQGASLGIVNCGPASAITSMQVVLGADPDRFYAFSLSIPMTVRGGGGADFITTGTGNDRIVGGRGEDILTGNGGSDRLIGGPDSDQIYHFDNSAADDGVSDEIDCGSGADTVVFCPLTLSAPLRSLFKPLV